MNKLILFLVIVSVCLWSNAPSSAEQQTPAAPSREDAYRANNLGVALLEQFKYKEGADAFKRALQIDPKLALARINLAIALYNVPDLATAQREAQAAIALAPEAPQPYYMLGLIAKSQARLDDAVQPFQQVLKLDPNDVGANINLGQIYSQQKKYPEAIAAFRVALAAEPYNATALYNLGTTLIRSGQREEGQRVIQRFQEFRQRGSGSQLGNNYLEQGRYADAIASTGAEPDLVDRAKPAVTFADETAAVFPGSKPETKDSAGGSSTFFDFDGDNDLDLFWTGVSEQKLYRNDAGKFVDITEASGALAAKFEGLNVGAVAGDYDNDSRPDLFVIRAGAFSLYHNDGNGKFSEVTSTAGIPKYPFLPGSVAFVDIDHDGDLDVFIAGFADVTKTTKVEGSTLTANVKGAPNMLLRNDGDGKFSDITAASKLNEVAHAVAIVPTDYNNRRDIDLLIVNYGKAPTLLSNQRDGTFRNVATDVGLTMSANWSCVAAGDVNKDGYTDFFLGRTDGPGILAISDGQEKFKTSNALATTANSRSAQFVDYDNDGLLDCVVLTDKGLQVLRNVGDGWDDVTATALKGDLASDKFAGAGRFTFADIDNDGDSDLVFRNSVGQLRIGRNSGSNNRSLRLNLAGKVSNRSGIGSKIEARAGSLIQKIETNSAWPAVAPPDVVFGIGRRNGVDAVRILWPAGIVQAETEIPKAPASSNVSSLPVVELDRKPSSCPYLYTWNGETFEFITDFMGGGEMGYLEAPGHHNTPDPVEYVRIRSDQLKPKDGRYELRVTNELEEALFLDRFQLMAIDHPQEISVYPDEGMTSPPKPFRLFITRNARVPKSAVDDHGTDVLDRIAKFDRRYPDNFKLHRIRGYAESHTLTMDLNAGSAGVSPASSANHSTGAKNAPVVLLLTGWTDYAWSSDNLAASHGKKAMTLPALQVKNKHGEWQTVIEDIGIPVGRPQTVTVDLTGKFLSASREVRIVTSMRIYWDQIQVADYVPRAQAEIVRLDPLSATLNWRGFSLETSADGREPYGYDYQKVSFTSPWKTMTGRYTREGDVRELLLTTDDMFVIAKPGDEVSLSFDASRLPKLKAGWTRTFLLYSDGYSKEMDINSASPDQVSPLPFHGMSKYPYPATESYPMTPERRRYIERYNTRVVSSSIYSIDCELALRLASPNVR